MNNDRELISMTDHDRLISETIRKNQEIILSLTLINQTLESQLPQAVNATSSPVKGYYICPKTGERHWFDEKAKARHERNKKRLTLKGQ